jgi:hypothetical protein
MVHPPELRANSCHSSFYRYCIRFFSIGQRKSSQKNGLSKRHDLCSIASLESAERYIGVSPARPAFFFAFFDSLGELVSKLHNPQSSIVIGSIRQAACCIAA